MKTKTLLIVMGIFILGIFLTLFILTHHYDNQRQDYETQLKQFCLPAKQYYSIPVNFRPIKENERLPLQLAYYLIEQAKGQDVDDYTITLAYTKCCPVLNLTCVQRPLTKSTQFTTIYGDFVTLSPNDSRLIDFSNLTNLELIFQGFTYDENGNYTLIK